MTKAAASEHSQMTAAAISSGLTHPPNWFLRNHPLLSLGGASGETIMLGQNCSRPALHCGQGTVRINHAAHRGHVTRLELGHGRADPGNMADDLMARHNRVIRGHELAPLVADRMEIGVTDAAE